MASSQFDAFDAGLEFKISDVQYTSSSVWWENVHRVTPNISKVFEVDNDQVPLFHVGRTPLVPEDVIAEDYSETLETLPLFHGADQPTSYVNGTVIDEPPYIQLNGNLYESFSSDIMITNRFINDEPLFWGDEIPAAALNFPITISDDRGQAVSANSFRSYAESHPDTGGTMRGVVAHNFWASTSPFYLSYQTAANEIVSRVLDQSALFHQIGTRDVGTSYSGPKPDGFAYSVGTSLVGFRFLLQPSDKLAVVPSERLYLRADIPPALDPTEPWYMTYPRFSLKSTNGTYATPEWLTQTFTPRYPYIYIKHDIASVAGDNLLQVSRLNPQTAVDSTNYIEIIEYDQSDNILRGITNNATLNNQHVGTSTAIWATDSISVVQNKGWINITQGLNSNNIYDVSYSYYSEDNELKARDINPWRDVSLRGKTFVPYLVPKTTDNPYQVSAVEYLIYDQDGIITEISQTDTSASYNPYIDATGRYFRSPTTTSALPSDDTLALTFTIGTSFLEEYCLGNGTGKYLVLGEFTLPERLDEPKKTLITNISRELNADEGDAFQEALKNNPYQAIYGEYEYSPHKVNLPIHGVLSVHLPWEYNSSNLHQLTNQVLPSGFVPSLHYKNTPELLFSSADVSNTAAHIHWPRVPYYGTNKISGQMYLSTDNTSFSTQGAQIDDLFVSTTFTYTASTDIDVYYLKMLPTYVSSGATSTGVYSNVISFSFKSEG